MGRFLKYRLILVFLFSMLYNQNIISGAEIDLTKIHPRFRSLVTEEDPTQPFQKINLSSDLPVPSISGNSRFGVLIKTDNIQELEEASIPYNSAYGDFVTAKITIDELKRLSTLAEMLFTSTPRRGWSISTTTR